MRGAVSTVIIGLWLLLGLADPLKACKAGLTQLRYRYSLELIHCNPREQADAEDECIDLTGGFQASCQKQLDGEHVCCGSPSLLISLVSGSDWNILNRPAYDSVISSSPIKRKMAPTEVPFPLLGNPPLPPSPTATPKLPRQIERPPDLSDLKLRPTKVVVAAPMPEKEIAPEFGDKNAGMPSSPTSDTKYVSENGPVLSLLSTGRFDGLDATSTVAMLTDGACTIIINTGMPGQRRALEAVLGTNKAPGKTNSTRQYNFTVLTSTHPQFIGNLNLFPAEKTVIDTFVTRGTAIAPATFKPSRNGTMLCSPNTMLFSTPGPSLTSTTVVAFNVPSMGTVAITGALFFHDDNLTSTIDRFTLSSAALFQSRRQVVCMADWIIPAHAGPIPVSAKLRYAAGCGD